MTECQHCGGRAQLFLCNDCTGELREMLIGLPRWIDYLADAALGQVRMAERVSTEGRRSRRVEVPLKLNLRASDLLAAVTNSLTTITRDLIESRGADPEIARTGAESNAARRELQSCSPLRVATIWLAQNVSAIAASEGAAETYNEIRGHIAAIELMINRPKPPRFCGPCPTWIDEVQCQNRLMAKRDAIEVTCRECDATHNIEQLINRMLADVDHWRFTREELIGAQRTSNPERYWRGILDLLGEHVPWRTFHDWCAKGKLLPRGYRRPDGRRGLARHGDDDQPEYRLADVRKLRTGEREDGAA